MNPERPTTDKELREQRNGEIFLLAAELSRNQESFPFPGIDAEAYERIKAADQEYPGITTPIEEIVRRCQAEGIKVIFGKNPDSTNVFILPAQSTDVENDSIVPKTLLINFNMDEKLRKLILLERARYQA
jgi:hypothetical protein